MEIHFMRGQVATFDLLNYDTTIKILNSD